MKWKDCMDDENTWEPLEAMKNTLEEVKRFQRENPEMSGLGEVEKHRKVFHWWTSKRRWFLHLLCRA